MTLAEVGEIRQEFRPGLDNVIAGVIIGLLLIAAGGAACYFPVNGVIESRGVLPFWADKGWCWGAVALLGALGMVMIAGGVLFLVCMRGMLSFRMHVGLDGFAVTTGKETQIYMWDDVLSVTETHLYERPPVLKGVAKYALPEMMSRKFLLNIKDRKPVEFDATAIKRHLALAEMIKQETDLRNIAWEIVEEHA